MGGVSAAITIGARAPGGRLVITLMMSVAFLSGAPVAARPGPDPDPSGAPTQSTPTGASDGLRARTPLVRSDASRPLGARDRASAPAGGATRTVLSLGL